MQLKLSKRVMDLQGVIEVGTAVSIFLESEKVMQTAVEQCQERFDLDHVQLYLLDEEGQTLTLAAASGEWGAQWVKQSPKIELHQEHSFVARSAFLREGLLSETGSKMVLPLLIHRRVLGVLVLVSHEMNGFDDDAMHVYTLLARQVAIALENAHRFEKERKIALEAEEQAKRMALLNEMSKQMNLAVSENDVFEVAARYTPKIIQANRSSVALVTESENEFEIIALKGVTGALPRGKIFNLQGSTIGTAVRERRLVVTPDSEDAKLGDLRSTMNAPLITSGQTIGTLNVACREGNAYQSRAQHLILQMAPLLASNIEGRRLFAQTKDALAQTEKLAHRLTRLNNMGQLMNQATSEKEIFKIATSYTQQIIEADRVSVALPIPDSDLFEVYALCGEEGAIPVGVKLSMSNTSVGQAVREKRLINIPNLLQSNKFEAGSLAKRGLRAVLNAPMMIGEHIVGVLNIASKNVNAYNKHDEDLLWHITSFLATTIENTRLYREAEHARERLKAENIRLESEVDVVRQVQQMILPNEDELQQVEQLDIAYFMEPADEVGGDYLDILQHNGHVKIGIGDVTGHGLESGVLMLMTQMGVRTLLTNEEQDANRFMSVLNRTIYDNVQRMESNKSLTLSLLDYSEKQLTISGQHEELIVVRKGGQIELIDTFDFGFPIGLDDDISDFVNSRTIPLQPGDGVVLYTDGITEAENMAGEQYELERLCHVISRHWQKPAAAIKDAVMTNLHAFIGQQKVHDDITLLVLKQK